MKNTQISNFIKKIRPLRPELIHAYGRTDGQTDVTKLKIVFFRNFANAPKNGEVH
jgi:hypothetical protein